MAYSDFTFTKLKKDYGIEQQDTKLFESIVVVAASSRLQQDIEDAKMLPLYSEKAKSEAIIFPILRELRINNPNITIFSGYALSVEKYK